MGRKKIVREPVEKLSSETIVEITEDSSSEEEEDNVPMIKPKPVKKPRTEKQLANDQRLRDRKKKKVEPVIDEMDISTHPVKPVPVAINEDDKHLTKKEILELMEQKMNAKPEPVKKPRKKRATKAEMAARKSEKVVVETPLPTPPPTPQRIAPPQMLFA